MDYLKIIRPVNLAMVVLTQLLFWFFIVVPIHRLSGSIPDMQIWQVLLLVLSTVLIAAGGYVINDYYDLPIDLVNKPDKVIVSKSISDDNVFTYYMALSGVGLIASLIVAITQNRYMLVLLPVIVASLLWFYAQSFKRLFLVGNLVVALCTALVIFILIYFEIDWERIERVPVQANQIMIFGAIYMTFAFITSLLRELVKDMQDKDGDAAFDCKTLPIVAGLPIAKIVAAVYSFILLAGIGFYQWMQIQAESWYVVTYLLLGLELPLVLVLVKLYSANTAKDFNGISTLVKIVMLIGTLSMLYIGLAYLS
jgi:4-hydroxybenzoate polyprenyltransferase